MIVVDQAQSGHTVSLPVGQVIELRLAENPTTGYRWTFTAKGEPVCVVLGDHFEGPKAPPGAGGQHLWQIKASTVGECDIAMRYGRSFEPDAPGQAFTLHVRVTP